MYLQSDGSDKKKFHSRPITGASAVDECQTMFYPKVYSSAADSLSGGSMMFIQKAYFQE